jgi:hypothetical protein
MRLRSFNRHAGLCSRMSELTNEFFWLRDLF